MLILVTSLMLCGALSAAGAVAAAPSTARPDRAALVLRIESTKKDFALYEPVTLNYSVTNPTTHIIKANVVMLQSAGRLTFLIRGPDHAVQEYKGRGSLSVVANETVHDPGSIMASQADLDWNGEQPVFPAPGRYEIRAQMFVGRDPDAVVLESNAVEVEVRAQSGIDADAINEFSSRDDFVHLLRDGAREYCSATKVPHCFDSLREFARRFTKSSYAPRIAWELAAAVAHGGLDVDKPQDASIELFQECLRRWPDDPIAPRVMYGLTMALNDAGRQEEAVKYMDQFASRFPERRDLIDSLQRVVKRPKG